MVEGSPRLYMYFTAMWDEIPSRPCYRRDPTGERLIRDYNHMLRVLNRVFSYAPQWTDAAANVACYSFLLIHFQRLRNKGRWMYVNFKTPGHGWRAAGRRV